MAATQTLPIVFTTALDPVAARYVASFNRPSGNVTGVTLVSSELVPKRLNRIFSRSGTDLDPAGQLSQPKGPMAALDDRPPPVGVGVAGVSEGEVALEIATDREAPVASSIKRQPVRTERRV